VKGDIESNIGSKQGALTGSIFSNVPVLLVETCSLTNKHDADWIRQPKNQLKMALALAKGCAAARDAAMSGPTQAAKRG
jgi:N-acetylmuramoyl-L-alanine amidase